MRVTIVRPDAFQEIRRWDDSPLRERGITPKPVRDHIRAQLGVT
jgi:hypothetical protein